ncbi:MULTISPECIES: hypothetical protein [unclassified Saccharothrix]|uniref:hypothetical protein n=1 Tax=unclassified Saccharothrix TaxID=2593673 RepID=UPI00307F265C
MIGVQGSAGVPSSTAEPYHEDGTPLAFADRIARAEQMLRSCPELSDRSVAAATGLSTGTVAAVRVRAGAPAAARIGRDGRIRPVSCADGREAAADYLTRHPGATLREVARAAGISVGTARDVRTRLWRGEEIVPSRGRTGRKPARAVRPTPIPDSATTSGSARSSRTPSSRTPSGRAPSGRAPEGRASEGRFPEGRASDSRAALAVLRHDPSLRGAQAGRQLLTLLVAHATVGDWRHLAETLPAHCDDLVAALAAEYSDGWAELATQLDHRRRAAGA